MQKSKNKILYYILMGSAVGFSNGFFGSGGGVIAVPLLTHGLKNENVQNPQTHAHATSLALTFPLSIISLILYSNRQPIQLNLLWPILLAGVAGAVLGGLVLKKLTGKLLHLIFGGLLIASSIRILWMAFI